jgi:hypothetical protein
MGARGRGQGQQLPYVPNSAEKAQYERELLEKLQAEEEEQEEQEEEERASMREQFLLEGGEGGEWERPAWQREAATGGCCNGGGSAAGSPAGGAGAGQHRRHRHCGSVSGGGGLGSSSLPRASFPDERERRQYERQLLRELELEDQQLFTPPVTPTPH